MNEIQEKRIEYLNAVSVSEERILKAFEIKTATPPEQERTSTTDQVLFEILNLLKKIKAPQDQNDDRKRKFDNNNNYNNHNNNNNNNNRNNNNSNRNNNNNNK